MTSTHDILIRGYFPKELPPPFSTASFAQQGTLPAADSKESVCVRYSYSKYASVRRTLGIPNPAHVRALANIVSKHWSEIVSHCAKSPYSRTTPVVGQTRAIEGMHSLDKIASARTEIRTGARYVLKADVTNFYGNIYTHVIPWVFHTKSVAKHNRQLKPSARNPAVLWGNLLDAASRNIQSGQTVGIPVGPDTSFAIAESILCEVDVAVQARLGTSIRAFRFVDDYEFACASFTEAEEVRAVLQDVLAEFELQLNSRKTQIIELPDVLDTAWVHELASFPLDADKPHVQESQLLRYFSRAFELMRENAGEPVLKYAVRRLSEVDCAQVALLVQRLLLQAAAADPGTLHTALYVLQKQSIAGNAVDMDSLKRALSSVINHHSPLQHGGDVAWALWGALVFQVSLDEDNARSLERLTDPVAVLVALHAAQEGRLPRSIDTQSWNAIVTPDELFDSRWLLVYDGVGKGWLQGSGGDPVSADRFFRAARSQRVTFYDESVPRTIPSPSPIGEYA